MSHKEEQAQEVEALESIFPSEFEVLKNEPFHSLRFTLKTDRYDNDPDNEGIAPMSNENKNQEPLFRMKSVK